MSICCGRNLEWFQSCAKSLGSIRIHRNIADGFSISHTLICSRHEHTTKHILELLGLPVIQNPMEVDSLISFQWRFCSCSMCLLPWLRSSELAKPWSLRYILVWVVLTTNVKLLAYHKENPAGRAILSMVLQDDRHHLTDQRSLVRQHAKLWVQQSSWSRYLRVEECQRRKILCTIYTVYQGTCFHQAQVILEGGSQPTSAPD